MGAGKFLTRLAAGFWQNVAGPAPRQPAMSIVLVAEPDPALRRLLTRWLADLGHTAVVAAGGTGLAAAARAAGADALLTEVGGGPGTGLAAAEAVRAASEVGIVLASGGWTEARLARARAIRAAVLQKPFSRAELVVALARATPPPSL